jgi:hypothetical protein
MILSQTFRRLLLALTITACAGAQNAKIPPAPIAHGGLVTLSEPDRAALQKEYGEFELLDFRNARLDQSRDSITAHGWGLAVKGKFRHSGKVEYAALARVKSQPDGVLLIMLDGRVPADSTGLFYHSYIGLPLLLRTRAGANGAVDTLEFACAKLNQSCGRAYVDATDGTVRWGIVAQE